VQLQAEHFFDLLVTIASQSEGSEWGPWNMVVLDILHLLFRGVNPADVAGATSALKATTTQLNDLLSAEKRVAKAEKRKGATRHSRFGTTLTLTSVRHIAKAPKRSNQCPTGQPAVSFAPAGRRRALAVKGHRHGEEGQGEEGETGGAQSPSSSISASQCKQDDLAPPSRYRSDALVALRTMATSFVENSLNGADHCHDLAIRGLDLRSAFFTSVLKDIRLEREKVKETDNVRVLVVAAFFLEFFLLLHKQDKAAEIDPASEKGHDFDLIGSLTEISSIAYALARMKIALEDKVRFAFDAIRANELSTHSRPPGRSCTPASSASSRWCALRLDSCGISYLVRSSSSSTPSPLRPTRRCAMWA
jgi:replication fork protection complex subunit Tof1/Swi1